MNSRIKSFLRAFYRITKSDPKHRANRVYNGNVLFQIQGYDDCIWIDCLKSIDKRKGNATKAMNQVCKLADKYCVPICLDPIPYGNDPLRLNEKDLISFYRKFNFEFVRPEDALSNMERQPKNKK